MPTAALDDLDIHFVQMGRGPDVVLIHGLASDLAFWYLGVMRLLRTRFRLTAFDLRGHGYSSAPPHGYTSAVLADDLRRLMNHLQIDRAHVIGHSFGGSVALHLALSEPSRIQSLVLADARVNDLQPRLPHHEDARWTRVRTAFETLGIELPVRIPAVAYAVLEEVLQSMARDDDGATAAVGLTGFFGIRNGASRKLERWIRLMESTTAKTDFNAVAGLTRERLAEIACPVLGVYGESSCCLETCRGLQQHIAGCSVSRIPGVGHLHPFLAPAAFADRVEPFLAGQRCVESRGIDGELDAN